MSLIGTDEALSEREVAHLLTDSRAYSAMSGATNPYGDGRAAEVSLAAIRTKIPTDV